MKNFHYAAFIALILALYGCEQFSMNETQGQIERSDNFDTLRDQLGDSSIDSQVKDSLINVYAVSLLSRPDNLSKQSELELLSTYLYEEGRQQDYQIIARNLQKVSRKRGDSVALAKSLSFTGAYFRKEGILDSAFTKFYEGAKIYEKIEMREKAGLQYLSMAILQKIVRDYAGSESSSIKAIQNLKAAQPKDGDDLNIRYLASAYNNLGIIAKERGQYDVAIDYYTTVLDLRSKIDKNGLLESGTNNNIGLIYARSGDYDAAIRLYRLGLANEKLLEGRPETYARLLDNMAFAMFKADSTATVDSIFSRALAIRTEEGDLSGTGTSYYHLAQYYIGQNKMDEGRSVALKSLDYAEIAGNNKGVLESLELLSDILPPVQALPYAQKYMELSRELEQSERVYQDQFARVRFETDVLLSANKRATKNLRQLAITFLATVVFLLLGYIWRQRVASQKEKVYQRAQQKSTEEIYSLMLAQSAKIEEGKQLEKRRISEELHDNVLSKLFGIRISLDSVHKKEGEQVVKARSGYLKELQEITQEIRQISHELNRDSFLRGQLFPEVLDGLITDFGDQTTVDCMFSFDKNMHWDEMSDATKAHLYRIIQESLVNAHNHGKAHHIEVSFKQDSTHWTTIIMDDGEGIDLKRLKKGIGLKNIASRTEQIEGEFYIQNVDPRGTAIEIHFPRKKI